MPTLTLQDFRRAAGMMVEPDVQLARPEVDILADQGAEENRKIRMQFLSALETSMTLPVDYMDQVATMLGLDGQNQELASTPLVAREIKHIILESSVKLADIKNQASMTAMEVTDEMLDGAMANGVSIQLDDILLKLSQRVSAEELPYAQKVAIDIFNEQMAEHLKDVAAAVDREWRSRPERERTREAMRDQLEAFLKYSRQVLDLSRDVSSGSISVDDALRRVYRDFGMFVTMAGVMGTLAAISKAIVVVKTFLRQADALEAKAELKREAAELEDRIEAVKALLEEIQLQKAAACAASGKKSADGAAADPAVLPEARLEWKRRELEEAVSGFADRVEALRREARNAAS